MLRALDEVAQAEGTAKGLRVAMGWNANLDLIVPAVPLLSALGVDPPDHDVASKPTVTTQQLSSRTTLAETFSHFFGKGAAAERFVQVRPPNVQRKGAGSDCLIACVFDTMVF